MPITKAFQLTLELEPPIYNTGFNLDTDRVSIDTGLYCDPEEGVTQQQFAEESDINTIVKRFGLTGELPSNLEMPRSGDFTQASDFQSSMQLIAQANSEFMSLPAHLRARFDHDPGKLISFLENDKNRAEALELGLVKPPPEVTRDVVKAVDDLAAKLTSTTALKP
ncbi:MAG: internal scaffolding protein [Microvirus sp.]|nr:MAG: internal scaffolding protein [Microvirus sp.]